MSRVNLFTDRMICLIYMIAVILASAPFAGAATYTYDDLNRLIKVEYADGSVIDYAYDAGGNLLTVDAVMTASNKIDLPRTGQTRCFDVSGTEISCTGSGQDGEIQAGVSWPSPRFTDNGDGTITDNLTGLMWLKDTNTFGNRTWQNALNAVADFNANPGNYAPQNYTATYTDWRLPNIVELKSLVDLSQPNPALPTDHPFVNIATNYWSSTSYALYSPGAWTLRFVFYPGYITGGSPKTNTQAAWPVRGTSNGIVHLPRTGQVSCYDTDGNTIACAGTGQDGEFRKGKPIPPRRFQDNGDGTVEDRFTGLVWTQNALPGGELTWQDALNYVAGMNAGSNPNFGQTDWRLPNRNEMLSLVNYEYMYAYAQADWPFSNTEMNYATSTTNIEVPEQYWYASLVGDSGGGSPKSSTSGVPFWPVRGGTVKLPEPPATCVTNGEFDDGTGWTEYLHGDGSLLYGGSLTITGADNDAGAGTTYAGQANIDTGGKPLSFTLLGYIPLDTDDYDYPVFLLDGVTYPLYDDGTLDGSQGGVKINNALETTTPITFIVDIDALSGMTTHSIGFGVYTRDSWGGAGVAQFDHVTCGVFNPCLVTTEADHVASPPAGSLRQVLANSPCCTTITFANTVGTIILAGTELTIPAACSNLRIDGSGGTTGKVTISGNNASRVLHVSSNAVVTLDALTITNGNNTSTIMGGGIYNEGTLIVGSLTTVSGNTVSWYGGGISNLFGTVTINGTVSGNTSTAGDGGGIYNSSGTLIVNGAINGNTTGQSGGGISNNAGTITVNGAVNGNTAGRDGGGIFNAAGTTTINGTVSGNSGAWNGGGIYNYTWDAVIATLNLQSSARIINNTTTGTGGGIFNIDEGTGLSTVNGVTSTTVNSNTATTCNNFYDDDSGCQEPPPIGNSFLLWTK